MKVPSIPCHEKNPKRLMFPAVEAASSASQKQIRRLVDTLRWYAGTIPSGGLSSRAKHLTHREQLEEDGGAHARRVLKEMGYD